MKGSTMAKKSFKPGLTWRVLAHKRIKEGEGWWICNYCGWRGQVYSEHPKSCKGSIGARDSERKIRHSTTVALHSDDFPEPTEFDELVIDDWFHLEQMNDRDWWLGIGNPDGDDYWHINVHVNKDGKATVSMEKQ